MYKDTNIKDILLKKPADKCRTEPATETIPYLQTTWDP